MGVDHFALQLASLVAVYNAEIKLRPDSNRLQRIQVTTVQAQFIQLRGNGSSVREDYVRIREKGSALAGPFLDKRFVSHYARFPS
jgi:hypothetical protein